MKKLIKKLDSSKKLLKEYKKKTEVTEELIQFYYHKLEDKVSIEDLRPARPTDIIVGQLIFINGDDGWYCRRG